MRPGDTWTIYFTTQTPDGTATDADSTPTATAAKNGSDDTGGGSFSAAITVTNVTTGVYKASGTLPTSYAPGDRVSVRIAATVDSTVGVSIVDTFVVESVLSVIGSVDDASATTTSFIGAAGLSSADNFYNGMFWLPISGALAGGPPRKIADYVGSTRTFTLENPLPSAPADGVQFEILGLSA